MAASIALPHQSQNQNPTLNGNEGRANVNLGNNRQICPKNGHVASKCFWRGENGNRGGRNNFGGGYNYGSDNNGYGVHVASFSNSNWQSMGQTFRFNNGIMDIGEIKILHEPQNPFTDQGTNGPITGSNYNFGQFQNSGSSPNSWRYSNGFEPKHFANWASTIGDIGKPKY
ncbi:hypothetical protein L1887_07610 [Cichorium endivia]|nr:hypothetical protein L1887_07610 [Cichorium endivia]